MDAQRRANRTWSEILRDFDTWNPLATAAGAVAVIGATALAAPIVAPAAITLAQCGTVAIACGTVGRVVHSNNVRAVAELENRSETQRIGNSSPQYIVEYPDD